MCVCVCVFVYVCVCVCRRELRRAEEKQQKEAKKHKRGMQCKTTPSYSQKSQHAMAMSLARHAAPFWSSKYRYGAPPT